MKALRRLLCYLFGRHEGYVTSCRSKVIPMLHYVTCKWCGETDFNYGWCKDCRHTKGTSMIYGHNKTIHRTEQVDVEVDKDGTVVSVWFRCMALPFNQTVVGADRAAEMLSMYAERPMPPVLAIEFGERPAGT